jgi:tetratricopeptide (TPR) repeat protein
MAIDAMGSKIEALIGKGEWKEAQITIEHQLDREPDDHWLWCRLSGVKYEKRDYQGGLEAAEKALKIVPDCPLALWSKAGAVEMLGNVDEARGLYLQLVRRGSEELKNPDDDADECWEGRDRTFGLVTDCFFAIAGCLAKTGQRDEAIKMYGDFISLVDLGERGIYSREDALKSMTKLVPSKKAKREAAVRKLELMENRSVTPQTVPG